MAYGDLSFNIYKCYTALPDISCRIVHISHGTHSGLPLIFHLLHYWISFGSLVIILKRYFKAFIRCILPWLFPIFAKQHNHYFYFTWLFLMKRKHVFSNSISMYNYQRIRNFVKCHNIGRMQMFKCDYNTNKHSLVRKSACQSLV